jgi:hypothetical protein
MVRLKRLGQCDQVKVLRLSCESSNSSNGVIHWVNHISISQIAVMMGDIKNHKKYFNVLVVNNLLMVCSMLRNISRPENALKVKM